MNNNYYMCLGAEVLEVWGFCFGWSFAFFLSFFLISFFQEKTWKLQNIVLSAGNNKQVTLAWSCTDFGKCCQSIETWQIYLQNI